MADVFILLNHGKRVDNAASAARAADELTNEGSSRADVQNGNDMREKVADLMQMDVEPVPAAPAGAPMMNTAPEPATPVVNARETLSVQNSADEPGFESPSGRFLRRGDSASEGEDSVESPAESEPPLTDEVLAAFAEMRHPNPERMAQHLASVEAKLRGAADLPEDGGTEVPRPEERV